MGTTATPPEPRCPSCGAPYFACETDAYGLCAGSVGEQILDAMLDEMNEALYGPLDAA